MSQRNTALKQQLSRARQRRRWRSSSVNQCNAVGRVSLQAATARQTRTRISAGKISTRLLAVRGTTTMVQQ
jgi:hypothetical protein